MTSRIALCASLLAVLTPYITRAEPPTGPAVGTVKPASAIVGAEPNPLQRLHISARSGAEWLMRVDNPVSGRFLPGWLPALNLPLDQDNYVHQAGAAYTLARAARYFGDERYLMKARQATLSLLAETQTEPDDPTSRVTTLPPIMVNRIAAAGALLMVIHELKDPAEDLLKQGEQLANYLRKQQQASGALATDDPVVVGLALQGLMLSTRNQPAPWKLELASKALAYYAKQWKSAPSLAVAAGLTPAFVEAYARTKEQGYADFVFEMSDWVCTMQYGSETAQAKWVGGFKALEQGRPVMRAPDITGAGNVAALASACLVTRYTKDTERWNRYRAACDLGAQFVERLQYTESNTAHFMPAYRPALIGGYHASLQDGNLRLDYNQHAVTALIQRLTCVGDR